MSETLNRWMPLTRENIRVALEEYIEWETDDRSEVSAQSAAVFVAEMSNHSITIREAAEALWRYGPTVPVECVVETAYGAALDGDEGLLWRARVLGIGRLLSRGLPLGAPGQGRGTDGRDE